MLILICLNFKKSTFARSVLFNNFCIITDEIDETKHCPLLTVTGTLKTRDRAVKKVMHRSCSWRHETDKRSFVFCDTILSYSALKCVKGFCTVFLYRHSVFLIRAMPKVILQWEHGKFTFTLFTRSLSFQLRHFQIMHLRLNLMVSS